MDMHPTRSSMGVTGRTLFTLVPAVALGLVLWLLSSYELPVSFGRDWVPALGIELAFRIDGLSALMLLMITGVGVAVAAVVAIRVFWLPPRTDPPPVAHEGGPSLVLPPLILAAVGIVLGVFPLLAADLLTAASTAMRPGNAADATSLTLAARPDFGALGFGLLLGATVFALWDRLHQALERDAARIGRIGMSSHYERSLEWIPRLAAWTTRGLQNGRLPVYVGWLLSSLALVLVASLWVDPGTSGWPAPEWRAATTSPGAVSSAV